MKFATIGHLDNEQRLKQIPSEWDENDLIILPEMNFRKTKGHFLVLKLTAKQMMNLPREKVRRKILECSIFAQNELGVELIQLGALTTSVTSGGVWLTRQRQYKGFVNHGDSYTAAVTIQATLKILEKLERNISQLNIAIIGAYGIIGEAISKILVPKFRQAVLIGRRKEKLNELRRKITGKYTLSTYLETKDADVIITASNHPTTLLTSELIKPNAIVVDVAQPPNVGMDVCNKRPDILRVDGGFVQCPFSHSVPFLPSSKIFACIAEVIMQATENEQSHHVGSIDINHLQKTERWAEKYGFLLEELTNFGMPSKLAI